MIVSSNLKKVAEALLNSDNEAYEGIEDEKMLSVVALALSVAADTLNEVAEEIEVHEVKKAAEVSFLDKMAYLASECDSSNDPELQKVASALDEILLTIGTPKGSVNAIKNAEEAEVNKLREKYRAESLEASYGNAKKEHDKQNNVEEVAKQIEDKVKQYRPLEHPLSTRCSPDMPGVPLMRIGDGVYQCPVTKKIYNYETGYSTMSGDKIPGTTVSNQTQNLNDRAQEHTNFSTRGEVLNGD